MDLASVIELEPNPKIEAFGPGDTVKVSFKEQGKDRVQTFQGIVIRVRNSGAGSSFTVRRSAYGVGVERTFPRYSPLLEKVEVMEGASVRRAKLYYLRGLSSRAIKTKIKPQTRIEKKARKG